MPDIEYENFVKINLFKLSQGYRLLDADERERGKQEYAATIDELSTSNEILSYSTVGTRADADIMLVRKDHPFRSPVQTPCRRDRTHKSY